MRRRWYLIVILAAVFAASALVGTGADIVTYDDVDTLELQPAGDGTYVQEGEDGEIRVVVGEEGPGVNDNAVTDLGAVFTVENVLRFGDPTAEAANRATVWIETDGNGAVTFYDVDTGEPIETRGDGVALSPGEAASVGMSVDTTGPPPEVTTLTVYAAVEDLAFESVEIGLDGETPDLNEEREVTATAVAGDETIDVSEAVEITDSSGTVEVDESGSVATITTVNPGGRDPVDGFVDVAVGDRTERVEFDIAWRETTTRVGGENGGVAAFKWLGVFDRIEFAEPVRGPVTVEAFEELPGTSGVPEEAIVQAVEVDVPEDNTDADATLRFALDPAAVDAEPDDLTVVHAGGEFATLGADDFEELDTDAWVDDGTLVVEADAPGFSAFAVTEGPIASEASTGGSGSTSSSSSGDTEGGSDDTGGDGSGDTGAEDGGSGGTADDTASGGGSTPDDSGTGGDTGTDGDTVAAAGGGPPIEIGGVVSGPLWYLLALAAATLFLVFAYRRRDDDGSDTE